MGFGVSLWLKNQAVLSYTLNTAFYVSNESPRAGDNFPARPSARGTSPAVGSLVGNFVKEKGI